MTPLCATRKNKGAYQRRVHARLEQSPNQWSRPLLGWVGVKGQGSGAAHCYKEGNETQAVRLAKVRGLKQTSLASITVPTPTVSAWVGTWLISPSKNLAFAWMVSRAKVLIRVLDTKLDPGSLKAMWPSGPMPKENNLYILRMWRQIETITHQTRQEI